MKKKIKIITVFGTRPDAVKMAPLVKALSNDDSIESVVCVTGQHREMLDQVLNVFDIKPDYDLKIMKKSQTLEYITSSIMKKFGQVLETEKPDFVLVHGDTATCLISSLTAFYQQIPVGHVEAGLRSYDIYSPFPEEMNRKLVGSLATLHFSPTVNNRNNLLHEGIKEENIFITGNTVIDALHTTVTTDYHFECDELNKIDYVGKRVIAMTAHRRENLGKPLENICEAVSVLSEKYDDILFVYPVHLNPAVMDTVYPRLSNHKNILLTSPVNVRDLHNLMKRSYLVLTDSGGLQEEAPSLGKPVLVMRKETERPEAVEAGTVKLTGTETDDIIRDTSLLLDSKEEYDKMANAVNPYGDGHASEKIIEGIKSYFNRQ
ncbi:MAG: UDP-N-acetylglucosamine 2-epimerase (non-hydrolyzing) [Clostridia bacterium]|nr:UDP-N-acetylglucosamine 2-epimerase (non-hydrolyzing) [Clostridia bacterium]